MKRMGLGDLTISALNGLRDSGSNSFEDLLRELLALVAGTPFRLCRAGSQGGADAIAERAIAMEAKRYRSSALNIRELRGEIDQATSTQPGMELWVLATTGKLGGPGLNELITSAADHGVALCVFDADSFQPPLPTGLHALAALCALSSDRVCQILGNPEWQDKDFTGTRPSLDSIRQELADIRALPQLEGFRKRLEQELQELPTWQILVQRQNRRLKRRILEDSKTQFRTEFDHLRVVPRDLKDEIQRWLNNSLVTSNPPLGMVIGERFDGKTWCVFDWLVDHLDNLPIPVFFLDSARGDQTTRLREHLEAEMAESLGKYGRHARALLERQRSSKRGQTPWALVLLDGLNEYHLSPYRPFEHLSWALGVAEEEIRPCCVLGTVRRRSWQEIRQECQRKASGGLCELSLGPFNDEELAQALAHAGKTMDDLSYFQQDVLDLVRRPRYMELVLEHQGRLGNFETVTVDVLLYLDATDPKRRGRPGSPKSWTEKDYQAVLVELVRKSSERHRLSQDDVLGSLETRIREEEMAALADLQSEGVVETAGGKFKLREDRFIIGRSLAILEELDEAADRQENLRERLRDLVSPIGETDTAVAWLRRAAVFALLSEGSSPEVIEVLLEEWLGARNLTKEDIRDVRDLARLLLTPLSRLAPNTWSYASGNDRLQEISTLIFSEFISRERDILRNALGEWFRLVPPRGPSFTEDENGIEEKMVEQLNDKSLGPMTLRFARDSGVLRLQNMGLYLESLAPGLARLEDLLALLAGRHVPFYHLDGAGPWIFRQSFNSVSESWFATWEQEARKHPEGLLATVIYHLLRLTDRLDLRPLATRLEPPTEPMPEWYRDAGPLDRQEYERICRNPLDPDERALRFLERTRSLAVDPELPPPDPERLQYLKTGWTEALGEVKLQLENSPISKDHLFEETLPSVAAWIPDAGADFIRRQIGDLPHRLPKNQHWWILSIGRHAVLAEGGTRESLQRASRSACPDSEIAPGFALLVLMPGFQPHELLEALLTHPLPREWKDLYDLIRVLRSEMLSKGALAALEATDKHEEERRKRCYFILEVIGAKVELSPRVLDMIEQDLSSTDTGLRYGALRLAVLCKIGGLSAEKLLRIVRSEPGDKSSLAPSCAALLLVEEGRNLENLPAYWRARAAVKYPDLRESILAEVEIAMRASSDIAEGPPLPGEVSLESDGAPSDLFRRVSAKTSSNEALHFINPESTIGGFESSTHPSELKKLFDQEAAIAEKNRLTKQAAEIMDQHREEHKRAWYSAEFPQNLVDDLSEERFVEWSETLLHDPETISFWWTGLLVSLFRRALRRGHSIARQLWPLVYPFVRENTAARGTCFVDHGIDWVLHELSRPVADDELARHFLYKLAREAQNDRELQEIAVGARYQTPLRLTAVAQSLLSSEHVEDRARAARLLGWIEGTEVTLTELTGSDPSDWVRRIAQQSLEERQSERFARHWFEVFLTEENRERRWGAAQLFLETVDICFGSWSFRRLWDSGVDVRTRGEAFLLLREAKSAANRRMKKLAATILDHKVFDLELGCHPWTRRRRWERLEIE